VGRVPIGVAKRTELVNQIAIALAAKCTEVCMRLHARLHSRDVRGRACGRGGDSLGDGLRPHASAAGANAFLA
jgi:hypothetical protein